MYSKGYIDRTAEQKTLHCQLDICSNITDTMNECKHINARYETKTASFLPVLKDDLSVLWGCL